MLSPLAEAEDEALLTEEEDLSFEEGLVEVVKVVAEVEDWLTLKWGTVLTTLSLVSVVCESPMLVAMLWSMYGIVDKRMG